MGALIVLWIVSRECCWGQGRYSRIGNVGDREKGLIVLVDLMVDVVGDSIGLAIAGSIAERCCLVSKQSFVGVAVVMDRVIWSLCDYSVQMMLGSVLMTLL